jgi:hypothetical protein
MKTRALIAMFSRDARLFLRSLWRALFLCAVFAVLLAAVLYGMLSSLKSETETPISVALVDEDASLLSRLATNFVKGQKDVAALINVQNADYETALAGVASGDFGGAVVLPEGYLNAIMVGDFVRGKVLLSDGALVDASLIRRVARTGERLIRMGQYGVFAGASVVASDPEVRQFYDMYLLRINDSLMYEASTANDRYVVAEQTSYASSSLPLAAHMALILILAICSVSVLFFYRCQTCDMSPALTARLVAQGASGIVFVIPKICYGFLFRLCLSAVALVPLSMVFDLSLSPFAVMGLTVALLLGAAFDTLLSLCLAGNRFGIAILSLFFVIQLFFAGGILPLHYLPPALRTIGRALPLGSSFALTAPILGATPQWSSLLWLCLWIVPVLFFAIKHQRKICTEGGRSA